MEARIFEHASAMPAPTWYFLRMNDATIEIPSQLSCEADAVIETDATLGDATAFVEAMEAAQAAWDKVYGDKPVLTNAVDEQAEELGGLALSAYQKKADAMEQAKSLAASFEQGMGEEVSDWIREMACQTRSIIAPAGSSHTACIQISGVDGVPTWPPSTSSPTRARLSTSPSSWTPPLSARASPAAPSVSLPPRAHTSRCVASRRSMTPGPTSTTWGCSLRTTQPSTYIRPCSARANRTRPCR